MGYAPFSYENLTMDAETLTATVDVTNCGAMAGVETVQVYFRDLVSSVMTPVKRLIAFKQLTLQPGEAQEVSFSFTRDAFSFINRDEQRVTEPGDFELYVGHSARDCDLLTAAFTLT